ncbi:unnamed protein product, partial [Phaeothamnion confervicola]
TFAQPGLLGHVLPYFSVLFLVCKSERIFLGGGSRSWRVAPFAGAADPSCRTTASYTPQPSPSWPRSMGAAESVDVIAILQWALGSSRLNPKDEPAHGSRHSGLLRGRPCAGCYHYNGCRQKPSGGRQPRVITMTAYERLLARRDALFHLRR